MYEFKLKEGLENYMQEWGYTSMREAAYDALIEYYECAGFSLEGLEKEFGPMSDDELFEAFDNTFTW